VFADSALRPSEAARAFLKIWTRASRLERANKLADGSVGNRVGGLKRVGNMESTSQLFVVDASDRERVRVRLEPLAFDGA